MIWDVARSARVEGHTPFQYPYLLVNLQDSCIPKIVRDYKKSFSSFRIFFVGKNVARLAIQWCQPAFGQPEPSFIRRRSSCRKSTVFAQSASSRLSFEQRATADRKTYSSVATTDYGQLGQGWHFLLGLVQKQEQGTQLNQKPLQREEGASRSPYSRSSSPRFARRKGEPQTDCRWVADRLKQDSTRPQQMPNGTRKKTKL